MSQALIRPVILVTFMDRHEGVNSSYTMMSAHRLGGRKVGNEVGPNEFRRLDPVRSPALNADYARRYSAVANRVSRPRGLFETVLGQTGEGKRMSSPGTAIRPRRAARPLEKSTRPAHSDMLGGRVDLLV